MNDLRQKILHILHITSEMLTALEREGYLSPRIWGALLVIGVLSLIILAPSRFVSSAQLPAVAIDQRLSTVANDETFLNTRDANALPLQSAPTAAALHLLELTPFPTPTPPFMLHTVQDKETLVAIAAEYNTATEAILTANDIRDPTALEVGQQLLIPPPEGLSTPVILHRLQPDDDLLSLAAQYGSSLKDILAANPGVEPEALPAGQTLVVPIVFNQPKPAPEIANSEEQIHYTVQSGDMPLSIAAQFDVPVEFLLASNDITDPTRLQVGQEIVIPPFEGEAFSFPVILHELAEDDTLLDIAIRYGSSVKDILAVNPELIPSALELGQVVAVPIIFSRPKPASVADETPPEPIEASAPLVDLQQQMFEAVNAEREANDLPPYEFDEALAMVAQSHAKDMVEREYVAHVTPEGKTVRDRIRAGGIEDAALVGENIQVNTKPRESTVQTALSWFMGSPTHRRGLLHQYYNRIGIGIVNGPPDWYTFVLVFAER